MSQFRQIRNRKAPFLDCQTSHLAVKCGDFFTKITDRLSGKKKLEKELKSSENGAGQFLIWVLGVLTGFTP